MDPTSTIATSTVIIVQAATSVASQTDWGAATDLVKSFQDTFGFFVSGKLQHNLLLIKIPFLIFSVFCLAAIIYLLKKTQYHHMDYLESYDILKDFKDYGASKALRQWKKIKSNFEKDDQVYWKLALLEAEKLMDEILIRMGLGTGTMDERLSRVSADEIPNLSDVVKARALCQDIARDPDYRLNKERAQESFSAFEKALIVLQVF